MAIHKTATAEGAKLRLLRSEESLRSRQYHGLLVRVVYEREFLEIVRTEMDAGSALDKAELGSFPVVHVVVEGSPVLEAPSQSNVLVPGDTVAVGEGEPYRFYNPTASRATILSILVKVSEQQQIRGRGAQTANS